MNDDKVDVTELAGALSKIREIYYDLVNVMHDENESVENRWEASELVKDGFYPFVHKIQAIAGKGAD